MVAQKGRALSRLENTGPRLEYLYMKTQAGKIHMDGVMREALRILHYLKTVKYNRHTKVSVEQSHRGVRVEITMFHRSPSSKK